jgi:beta-phosphoglucomutase-like phosphatase (HAD superfamily)
MYSGQSLTPADVLPCARETLEDARRAGLEIAVGSSSRNAKEILERTELMELLDAVVDGNDIQRSKPDPQVFLIAAERLNIKPAFCLVIEDAASGIEAAKAAGMVALAVGSAFGNPMADMSCRSLCEIRISDLIYGDINSQSCLLTSSLSFSINFVPMLNTISPTTSFVSST